MSLQNELFLTLMRLRLGLLHQDLAYRFKTNTRQVSTIILTWIQLLYKQFGTIRNLIFSTKDKVRQHPPKCFKKYKNIRCIIDCTEVHVQSPGNFEAQGNQYSSYKGHTTYKFLVALFKVASNSVFILFNLGTLCQDGTSYTKAAKKRRNGDCVSDWGHLLICRKKTCFAPRNDSI